MSSEAATPPRLVVRATIATLATVVFVLSAVFIVVTLDVRNRVRGNVVSSTPSSCTLPDVGRSSSVMHRAVVLLPQPDSPTIDSASPRWMSNDTPETACTRPEVPRHDVRRTVNSLTRSRTSSRRVSLTSHAPRRRPA